MMKDYFNFSQGEQRAIIALMVCVLILLVIRVWPLSQRQTRLEFYYSDVDPVDTLFAQKAKPFDPPESNDQVAKWNLKRFDINYASARNLREMGFRSNFISAWFKAKNEVGFVRTWEDFAGLELLEPSDLNRIRPFLDFTRYTNTYEERSRTPKEAEFQVDVNLADSLIFRELSGIGRVLSVRIVKYRSRLGGFYSINQLSEVYGIDSVLLDRLRPQLILTSNPEQLDINSSDTRQLAGHPYISWKQAQWIVRYREQHGRFESVNEVMRIATLKTEWFKRVSPYLKV